MYHIGSRPEFKAPFTSHSYWSPIYHTSSGCNYIFRKPNKRIFDLALEKAELQPDEVWYIGDQYECDVKGALYAGLLPIWYIGAIDLPYTEDTNILTVKTWNEIERYMEG